ncbi:MAG: response regulator [Dechloromonas sp.]|nr:response regulator [Dechloromonas sp.]
MRNALVVEDQDLMRQALMAELQAGLDDCFISGAQTYALAQRILSEERFNLVITDPGLPGFDPTSKRDRLLVVETIIRAAPAAIHVVVTGSDSKDEAIACRELGASAYLAKTGLSPGTLCEVLGQVAQDTFPLRYATTDAQVPEFNVSGLTPREGRVIELLLARRQEEKRREVFERMARELSIDAASAERYYKQARAKLLKLGPLPRGL